MLVDRGSGGETELYKIKKKKKKKKGKEEENRTHREQFSFDGFHEGKRRENLPKLETLGYRDTDMDREGRCFPDIL